MSEQVEVPPVGKHAKPRHRGPSKEQSNLEKRIGTYERISDKRGFHKPGSTSRHKQ